MSGHLRVRVVVLSFDGGQMTIDCLESLLATEWPAEALEIVMVDNGSLDDVTDRVRRTMPRVRILEPLANLGFAGGCNLGLRAPAVGGFEPDLFALVNNDATVAPGWLREMQRAIATADDIGAVSAKMLFADRFTSAEFEILPVNAADSARPDTSSSMCFTAVRLDGRKSDRISFDEGVFGLQQAEDPTQHEMQRWTSARGSIRIAHGESGEPVDQVLSVQLRSREPLRVRLHSGVEDKTIDVGAVATWHDIRVAGTPFDVINNVGSNLYRAGFGGDRGFLEPDRGQYEESAEVFAWCGGAVLLRREYLESVGVFDDRLFLYYEDTDLSWRGRLQGWRYVYEPRAVVRHRHAQSSGVGSPVFRFHTERNRLLVLAKCAPARLALRAGLGECKRTVVANLRGLVWRPLTLRMPDRPEAAHRRRVLASYLSLLPGVLRDRWMMDRRVARRSLMAWEVQK